jgi:hypothetical protein
VDTASLLTLLGYAEIGLCVLALCAITLKKQWADYRALGVFLAARASSDIVLAALWHRGLQLKAEGFVFAAHSTYNIYYFIYWAVFAIESIICLVMVYSIFRLAMAPLKGLQSLGMLVFRWAAAISVVVALGSVFGPGVPGVAGGHYLGHYLIAAISQLQRTQSILTLCLLVFVCFAVRPMGLSYSSRIFGVSLGLGLLATNDLVQSAWMVFKPRLDTNYNIVNGCVICLTLTLWTAYFALPEPKRRIIVLPTTSPFLRWNQISLALGDSPGFVAVGGVPPELFAPAELEVMRRASGKMVTPFPKSMGA